VRMSTLHEEQPVSRESGGIDSEFEEVSWTIYNIDCVYIIIHISIANGKLLFRSSNQLRHVCPHHRLQSHSQNILPTVSLATTRLAHQVLPQGNGAIPS
jgi:hypothetical protein